MRQINGRKGHQYLLNVKFPESLAAFWNSMINLQREYEETELNFWGYWDQMLSLKACILGKGSAPTGATSNPSRRLLGHILDNPTPMFLSLMDSLIALGIFTSATYNASSPGSQFEITHWEKGFQFVTFFSELCLSFCMVMERNWIYVT